MGLTPRVPLQAPRLLPGPTAQGALTVWLVRSVVAAVAWVVVVLVATSLPGTLGVVAGLGVLAVGLVGFFVVVGRSLPQRVGGVAMAELKAGYTTLPLAWGGFWSTGGRRVALHYHVPWDHSGTWVLTGAGTVKAAPRHDVLAPGLYPSVSRPGMLELWTGAEWAEVYAEPERPFLDT